MKLKLVEVPASRSRSGNSTRRRTIKLDNDGHCREVCLNIYPENYLGGLLSVMMSAVLSIFDEIPTPVF